MSKCASNTLQNVFLIWLYYVVYMTFLLYYLKDDESAAAHIEGKIFNKYFYRYTK